MSIQYINIGNNPNDGTGDDLRTAFLKVNDNFQFLGSIGLTGFVSNGSNLSGGSGEVFKVKNNETLTFRTIAAGQGITVNQADNTITIASSFTAPASITRVYADDPLSYYETSLPGASIKILGSGFVTTAVNANEITIDGQFSVFQDTQPTLGGDLTLNSNNIVGTGNIDITGNVSSTNISATNGSLSGTLTVNGNSTLRAVTATTLTASTSINSPSVTATTVTGNVTGNTTGTHYGKVSIKGVGILPDVVVVNTDTNPATITGAMYGSFSGTFGGGLGANVVLNGYNLTGEGTINLTNASTPLTVNALTRGNPVNVTASPTLADGGGGAVFTMDQADFGTSESLRLRTTSYNLHSKMPLGTSISFESSNQIDPTGPNYLPVETLAPSYMLHGTLGILNYKEYGDVANPSMPADDKYSTFVVRVRQDQTGNPNATYLKDLIVARGNNRVSIGGVDFLDSTILPKRVLNANRDAIVVSNNDLIITTETNTETNTRALINFYGDYAPGSGEGPAYGGYSFPTEIGPPGTVLHVQPGTNKLIWAVPGSGGAPSFETFLNLSDTPTSYATHANKMVVVNAGESGLEFTNNITATVTGSLIGNASTATALQTTRTINGKNFNGTQNITLTSADIAENTNLYFTTARSRQSVSVVANKALIYDSVSGVFDLDESVLNVEDTIIKRDSNGDVYTSKVFVSTLEKNSTDSAITFASNVVTSFPFNSTNTITTTGTINAGFINLTGTGNQTISSGGSIILNPATTIDVSGKRITNLPLTAPTQNSDAASKKYVDDTTSTIINQSFQQILIGSDGAGTATITKNDTISISGSTNITTSTTGTGVQISLDSTLSGISINDNLPVTGTITAPTVRGGNVKLESNSVTQTVSGNDLGLVPGTGGSVLVNGVDLKLNNARLLMTGFDIKEFSTNTLEQQISTSTATTFIRTLNWVDDAAGLAYAELPNGTPGQIKMIIMSSRGTYGNALDTKPRYLVLRGNINGASRSVNIAATDPNGTSTFIFLNNYWWRIANVA